MPQVLVDFIISLDGYASAEGWPGLWGMGGPEYLGWLDEAHERDHTVLMGANTYRLMWSFAAADAEGVGRLTDVDKVVFSSTLDEPLEWANSRLVRDDPVPVVTEMTMRTLGSLTLCRALLKPDILLEMVDHRTFDGRLQLLEYVPEVLDAPPGAA